jgi:cytochrome c551/c552
MSLVFAPLVFSEPAGIQIKILPGSAARGQLLLHEKGCLDCHGLSQAGAGKATDFGNPSGRVNTPSGLASAMWNHSPAMFGAEAQGRRKNALDSYEVADLFAFFYSTLYFSAPGNAARGKIVFREKNCAGCHSQEPESTHIGPAISQWTRVKDPVSWAERMWNHSGEMYLKMARRGIDWPTLTGQHVIDLFVYLRGLPAARSATAAFSVGEPERGRNIFEHSCESCHSFGPSTGRRVDLSAQSEATSVTDYIAAMWNHAPAMKRLSGPEFRPLAQGEMSHLIAFLFSQRYFFERGNAMRGARVYEAKNCAFCHEGARKTGAPDLTQATEVFSPITLTAAIWRHGQGMFAKTKQEKLPWPEFHGSEMANLIAYLNSRLVTWVAK